MTDTTHAHLGIVVVAVVTVVTMVLGLRAAHAVEPPELPSNYEALVSQADAKRETGTNVESARLYVQAYRALPVDQRTDEIGLFTVKNAIASYELALAQISTGANQSQERLTLLRDELELLNEFITSRPQGSVPSFIIEKNAEALTHLENLERQDMPREQPHDEHASPAATILDEDARSDSTALKTARGYELAYEAMDAESRDGPRGTQAVLDAVRFYCAAYALDRDTDHLVAARSLLAKNASRRIARGVPIGPEIQRKQKQINEAVSKKTGCQEEDPGESPLSQSTSSPRRRQCKRSIDCGASERCGDDHICHTTKGRSKLIAGIVLLPAGLIGLGGGIGATLGVTLGRGTVSLEGYIAGLVIGGISIPMTITGGILTSIGAVQLKIAKRMNTSSRPTIAPLLLFTSPSSGALGVQGRF